MVSKRKDYIAPFEVISTIRSMDEQASRPTSSSATGSTAHKSASVPQPGAPTPAKPYERYEGQPPPVQPMAGTTRDAAGGRIHLSVNRVTIGVVALAEVVLLAAAFALGRATAPAAPTGPVEAAKQDPSASVGDRRESGKYYLILAAVDGLTPTDRQRAEELARYCREHGEPATVETHSRAGKFVVLSMRGFDRADFTGERGAQSGSAPNDYVREVTGKLGRSVGGHGLVPPQSGDPAGTPWFVKWQ